MTQYDRGELNSIIYSALTNAQGWENDEVDANRQKAQEYYLGKPRGDELPGRSQQQSLDVGDMVNADLAQLTPMLSSDIFVTFEANGAEDEEQVESETRAVNKIIMEDEQGYLVFLSAIKDALLMRNCTVKVWMDDIETSETLTFKTTDETEVAFLLNELDPNQSSELLSSKDGETRIRYTTNVRKPRIRGVNPRNVLYTANWPDQDISDIPLFAERCYHTRSELVEMGFDEKEVDELPSDTPDWWPVRRDASDDYTPSYARETDAIQVYECYILIDQDGDGIAERYKAYAVNEQLLGDLEPWPWVPYAMGTGILYPHELMGESLFDRLKDVQDVKTAALRQWLDNLHNGNNSRTGVNVNTVNMDDATTSRPQGLVRVKGNPAESLMPIAFNDVGGSAQNLMDYQDKIRTERGGAALDMMQAEMQIVGDTAHGIERQYSSKELAVQMIGKTLAETVIRQVFLLMHATLRVFSNEPLALKFSGQWGEVNPSDWPERSHVNVNVGQTAGQRNAAQQALMVFIQMSMQLLQSPMAGQLVDLSGVHKAMADWLKMAGVDNPDQYLIDPTSPQAQQAAQQAQQQAQQQSELQMKLMQQQRKDDIYKHDTELQYKYFDSSLDAEVKEGEAVSKAMIEAAKMVENAKQQADASTGDATPGNGKAS